MKLTFLSLVFIALNAHASIQSLGTWNSDLNSVQATLFHILVGAANENEKIQMAQNSIQLEGQKVQIGSDESKLICEVSSTVKPEYRCEVFGTLNVSTPNAEMAQAVLFESMRSMVDRRDGLYPENLIRDEEGKLTLKDPQTILKCSVGVRGIEAVQIYSCEIL